MGKIKFIRDDYRVTITDGPKILYREALGDISANVAEIKVDYNCEIIMPDTFSKFFRLEVLELPDSVAYAYVSSFYHLDTNPFYSDKAGNLENYRMLPIIKYHNLVLPRLLTQILIAAALTKKFNLFSDEDEPVASLLIISKYPDEMIPFKDMIQYLILDDERLAKRLSFDCAYLQVMQKMYITNSPEVLDDSFLEANEEELEFETLRDWTIRSGNEEAFQLFTALYKSMYTSSGFLGYLDEDNLDTKDSYNAFKDRVYMYHEVIPTENTVHLCILVEVDTIDVSFFKHFPNLRTLECIETVNNINLREIMAICPDLQTFIYKGNNINLVNGIPKMETLRAMKPHMDYWKDYPIARAYSFKDTINLVACSEDGSKRIDLGNSADIENGASLSTLRGQVLYSVKSEYQFKELIVEEGVKSIYTSAFPSLPRVKVLKMPESLTTSVHSLTGFVSLQTVYLSKNLCNFRYSPTLTNASGITFKVLGIDLNSETLWNIIHDKSMEEPLGDEIVRKFPEKLLLTEREKLEKEEMELL